jgi:membrane protein
MRSLFLLPVRVTRRFFGERCAQTAAALSFSSLLGLVPLIAVAVAIITRFPFASGLSDALEKFLLANLLPDKAGAIVAKYVAQFAHKAERVQWIGAALLGITALVQMLTIEHAFNAIWRVREKRPLLRRLAFHLLALLLGPALFGGSLAAITFVASVSLGFFDEPMWFDAAFFRGLSFVFTVGMFALLYWAVPAKPVSRVHAVIGGIFAAAGFGLMQRLFSLYIANFPAYTVIYGAFAAIPIFLLWLYLSWGVILIGALVVAELPGSATSGQRTQRSQRGSGSRSNS